MPHQCTGCGERFEDGSKEMLSGCPECGGNKFQFYPKGADVPEPPEPPESPSEEPATDRGDSSVAETVGRATTRVRDFVSSSDEPDPNAAWPSESDGAAAPDVAGTDPETDDGEIIDADARRDPDEAAVDEDAAQASARSGLATTEDVRQGESPDGSSETESGLAAGHDAPVDGGDDARGPRPDSDVPPTGGGDRVVSEPTGDDPDLTELREQLNDQFESIKIVEPGQYELNLMELYDREEYIIALQENGRYVIQVPDQWIGNDLDDR